MQGKFKKDVLIALMNNRSDFRIAQEEGWYRIPVKSAPEIVRDGSLRYLAFYHTKIFGDQAFSVRWFGEVSRLRVVPRRELFPDLQGDPKAEREYYKIEFHPLRLLPEPIRCRRLRRILFISTTFLRFQQAQEINDVFHESPLEELLWETFKAERIEAERQYRVETGSQFFYLDFALFCKERKIDEVFDQAVWVMAKREIYAMPSDVGLEQREKREQAKASHLDEIKQAHPRAYEKWTAEEDERLKSQYQSGLDIPTLATMFQRQPSAIKSRLNKLGLG